jgi:streptogramin lyase
MRSTAAKLVASACLLTGFLLGAGSAVAAPSITGTFPLGSEVDTNNKIVAGPDGNVWLTVKGGTKDVARVTPAGQVTEFELEGVEGALGIAPGPDGNLWVPTVNQVTKFSPADPESTDKTFTIATIGADGQIVAGPDGFMWVASNGNVDRFNPANPEGDKQNFPVAELKPKDIDVAGALIVIADSDGVKKRIVTFTTAGTQKDLPIVAGAQGVAGAPSGQIAFSAPLAEPEQIGLIAPPAATVLISLAIPLPGDPFGVTFGADGAFWVVQFREGKLARVAPDGQISFLTGLPIESARQIAAGPDDTLWVTLTKNELKGVAPAVLRVSGVEIAKTDPGGGGSSGGDSTGSAPGSSAGTATSPPPETTLGKVKKVYKAKGKRAKVKITFSSAIATGFQCSLTRLKGKATKAAPFKACVAPKTYNLRPGRYKVQVRGLNGTVVDPSPAARAFKVVRIP